MTTEQKTLLEVRGLAVNYGGIKALKGVSLKVPEGEIVTLVGANGAGKSTTLRTISGLVKPAAGQVLLNGQSITGMNPQDIVKQGITMVPEGRHVFPDMTVRENLVIGAYLQTEKGQINADIDHVYQLFPRLKERHWQLAGTLSGGEQQMLAVGRAMMAHPRLMMMDEPSLGLAPMVVRDIFGIIRKLNEEGMTILLIEQNANAALRTAHYGYVLETGEVSLEGEGHSLLSNERVREAYLGRAREKA